jgi:hypothetical protein
MMGALILQAGDISEANGGMIVMLFLSVGRLPEKDLAPNIG